MSEAKRIFSHKPQINISVPSTGRMWLICGCAFACVLQSSLGDGGSSLIIALTALSTAILTEFLLTCRTSRGAKIKDGSAAATAMILTMLLPNQLSPVYVIFGTAFAITVVKYSFGGLGANWLNPALGGWLFIRFSWPAAYKNAQDGGSSVTDMVFTGDLSAIDNTVTEFFNSTIFSVTEVQLPSGYVDLLFNSGPGIIADRGIFALLIGTIIITAIGINRGWIPLLFLSVYGFLIRFSGDSMMLWNGDLLYGLFSGGTIAAAFILAAEPASSAKLKPGIILAVLLGAILSWFFRYKCMDYSGCFIAIALVNCITPIIRLLEERIFLSRKNTASVKENPV
ncbi:MAG: RnfABCDGE type electron transport complex subunit D [Treponema sp.]|nr:RnfABCDGE type electron transport complex subunit D [Treponema sp.]MCL2236768.1 RnfABCDGE type electron transport complex subunit D [Treponema sp.]